MGNVVNMKQTMNLRVRDVSDQHKSNVRDLPSDTTVGELVNGLVKQLGLPVHDSTGTPNAFHAYLDRDGGRHLRANEIVGEVLREGDEVVLQPDVQAGHELT